MNTVVAIESTAPAAQMSLAQQTASLLTISKAWNELYDNPRDSQRIFKSQLAIWAAFSKQSPGYIDSDRGSLIAAVVAGDDLAARSSWSRIRQETGGIVAESEPLGDVHAWKGDWTAAFRSYRKAADFGSAECTIQTNRGLDQAISAHLQQAIVTWAAGSDCSGPYELPDVHLALIGQALAAQNKWSAARSTWIKAARESRVVPEIAMLYSGNVMALSMLYHFASRFVASSACIKPGKSVKTDSVDSTMTTSGAYGCELAGVQEHTWLHSLQRHAFYEMRVRRSAAYKP